MRKLLICGALATCALVQAETAQAYEGAWCLKASLGFSSVMERCHFASFEACRGERGSWGSSAFCVQNPRFLPYWQGQGFERQPRRKLVRKKYRR
jgi:hypothetical protein